MASFASEVRRYYPFFPAVAAVARADIEFEGRRIPVGRRVLLDLWGTNRGDHHTEPHRFDPRRFLEEPGLFDLVAQGGGDATTGHRCPGERLTAVVMSRAIHFLLSEVDFAVQPAPISLRHIPTEPTGGQLLLNVHHR